MTVEKATSGAQLMIVERLIAQFILLLKFVSSPSFLSLLSLYPQSKNLVTGSEESDQTI